MFACLGVRVLELLVRCTSSENTRTLEPTSYCNKNNPAYEQTRKREVLN